MPTKETEKITNLIINIGRIVRERIKERDKSLQFSLPQLQILLFIAENPNPLMKRLADFLGVTPPSATSIINNMVKSRLVRRITDKKDRRAVCLAITPKGKKYLKGHFKKAKQNISNILTKLTREEQKCLLSILQKLPKII